MHAIKKLKGERELLVFLDTLEECRAIVVEVALGSRAHRVVFRTTVGDLELDYINGTFEANMERQ